MEPAHLADRCGVHGNPRRTPEVRMTEQNNKKQNNYATPFHYACLVIFLVSAERVPLRNAKISIAMTFRVFRKLSLNIPAGIDPI